MAVQIMPPAQSTGAGSAAPRELRVDIAGAFRDGFRFRIQCAAPPGFTILFGPSGAGKTTLLDCVAGLIRPDAGSIRIGDRVLFDAAPRVDVPVAQRGVGYVFQKLALFPHLTVEQNVEYGLSRLPAAERRRRSSAILESFGVAELRRRRPADISGGERQRVALARALVTDPCVLLLDEPLSALDATTRSRLIADLRAWNKAHTVPILYVTHSREEVFALGERVVVLEQGSVLAEGSPHDVLAAPRHETTAQLAGFENVFDATVVAIHECDGTMTCRLVRDRAAGAADFIPHFEVPLTRATVGTPVRIAVRAGDVMLATARPEGLSARNLLPGRVATVRHQDVTVIVEVDCGVIVVAHLTPAAEESLAIVPGREVWLVLKTHSCHLVERAPQP